jgi:galactonate dehydratase
VTTRKIGKIETFLVPPRWLFVRVESEDGAFGWGEASLEGWAEAVDGVFEAFRDRFVGVDPFNIERRRREWTSGWTSTAGSIGRSPSS